MGELTTNVTYLNFDNWKSSVKKVRPALEPAIAEFVKATTSSERA